MLKQITTAAAFYGWTVKENGDTIEVSNRNGKHVLNIKTEKVRRQDRVRIENVYGDTLATCPPPSIEKMLNKILKDYFYCQPVQGFSPVQEG
jgi:uncharacterized protein YxjI